MTKFEDIQKVYFIGIGGIGMSALARYFNFHGKSVSGYDKTETPLTKKLVEEGIEVHYEDRPDLIPKDVQLVVYTPAVPKDHKELLYYQQNDYPVLKRSDVLGIITNSSFNICVAGTHGKTTITTMIAHILRHTGYGCNAFLGGIAVNYNSNYWSDKRNVCVVEADEYDRSFLKLNPDIAVITAMDADHLDIYGTPEAMEEAFISFAGKIKPSGLLLHKAGLPRGAELKAPSVQQYSVENKVADVYSTNIRMFQGSYTFDVVLKNETLRDITLNMGGLHNVENITAAIGVARHLGIEEEKIRVAVAEFKGVKRRFEYIVNKQSEDKNGVVFVDDYAHHPEELRALISGAKKLFEGMKCTVIFQPHLFSRTKDFAAEFAESLDLADEVVLLPIYPARELPVVGVTSELITSQMHNPGKKILGKEELLNWIQKEYVPSLQQNGGLLITAGAGDIDALVLPIRNMIEN
ncbi:MAG: UDP-N-acetylmuramate--L-alanine ligase [Chitinophagaceae bacterium]